MAPQLSRGTCRDAGLRPDALKHLVTDLATYLAPSPAHPWCAGAVVLAGRGRVVALHEALGWAVRYAAYDETSDRGVELPRDRWVRTRPDTVFDLASLTKLCTALVAVRHVSPDRRVAEYVPGFTAAGKAGITVRHLLDHTSGLRPELPFYDHPTREARDRLLFAECPLTPPGTVRTYSDLNLIALQQVLECVTGRRLDVLVRDELTGPLGMRDTRFNPPASWRPRIAATEDQRRPWGRVDRGMVHGEVHDENAWAMGGVAGHAGLFSTAWDLALLCRALLDAEHGLAYPRVAYPRVAYPGLPYPGFERDQPWFMGTLAGPRTVGHTGFTGTSLVISPATDSFLVLLANSVHPYRGWRSGSAPRAAAASWLAAAIS